jgi:hypothetical protein
VSEHERAITIATNKTHNYTSARKSFGEEGKNGLDAWFFLFADWKRVGGGADAYGKAYSVDPKAPTSHSQSTVSQYLGAIDRAVKKYGSAGKARKAHEAWVVGKYDFADITNFKVFAPEGQRKKNNADKKSVKVSTVTLEEKRARTALSKAGFSKVEVDAAIKALFVTNK